MEWVLEKLDLTNPLDVQLQAVSQQFSTQWDTLESSLYLHLVSLTLCSLSSHRRRGHNMTGYITTYRSSGARSDDASCLATFPGNCLFVSRTLQAR